MRRLASFLAIVTLLLGSFDRVFAQQGSGGTNTTVPGVVQTGTDPLTGGPAYDFDPSQWTAGEPVTISDPNTLGFTPIQMEIPGGGEICIGCATYNTYTGPNGELIVVPTAMTAVMIGSGWISDAFGTQPDHYGINGLLGLAGLTGGMENLGISRDDILNGNWGNAMALWGKLNYALSGMDPEQRRLFENTMAARAGLFVFNADNCPPVFAAVGACSPKSGSDDDPNGNGNDPNNPFIAICLARGDCKVPWEPGRTGSGTPCQVGGRDLKIVVPDLQYIVDVPAPDNPVVVGQDQASKRGVDLFVQVTAPIVTMSVNNTYKVRDWDECKWLGDGTGGGCNDHPGDVNWGTEHKEEWQCRRDTYAFPDVLDRIRVTSDLSAASIAWITSGDLQQRYPGAKVYQSHWALWPGLPPATSGVSADGTQITFEWKGVPFRDPGTYAVTVTGRTLGTPYTSPRLVMNSDRTFQVALFEGALTK